MAVVVVAVVWLVISALINPVANVPLNDGWIYATSVRVLLTEHRLFIPALTTPTAAAQILWGSLFSSLFGFSYVTLRFSSLVAGYIGLVALLLLLREARASSLPALLGVLTLATCPLYVVLANSFMTDVPFVAASTAAALYLIRLARRRRSGTLVAGIAASILAVLTRQVGLCIPAASAMATLTRRSKRPPWLSLAVAPLASTAVVLAAYLAVRADLNPAMRTGVAAAALARLDAPVFRVLRLLAGTSIEMLLYSGLFLLPFLLVVLPAKRDSSPPGERGVATALALLATLGIVAYLERQGRWMPLSGNIMGSGLLGPPTLRDAYFLHTNSLPTPAWLPVLLTIFSVAGAFSLVQVLALELLGMRTALSHGRAGIASSWLLLLGLTGSVSMAVPFLLLGFFDRYLLPTLPLTMLACIGRRRAGQVQIRGVHAGLALAAVLLQGSYSVVGTHDYLAWNRTRWRALDRLVTEGVAPAEIDGGYEFNKLTAVRGRGPATPHWSPNSRPRFVVSFGQIPGFVERTRYPCATWAPWAPRQVLVLRRSD